MECRAGFSDFGVNDIRMRRMMTWINAHLPQHHEGDGARTLGGNDSYVQAEAPWGAAGGGPIPVAPCNGTTLSASTPVDPLANFRNVSQDAPCAEYPYVRPSCNLT